MNTFPLPSLVCRLNQNINATSAAIRELATWAEARARRTPPKPSDVI